MNKVAEALLPLQYIKEHNCLVDANQVTILDCSGLFLETISLFGTAVNLLPELLAITICSTTVTSTLQKEIKHFGLTSPIPGLGQSYYQWNNKKVTQLSLNDLLTIYEIIRNQYARK